MATISLIEKIFESTPAVEPEQVGFLIDFLKERHLCCDLQDGQYFFPDAAAANEPPIVKQLLQQPEKLSLRFDLAYLPLGLHARLVQALFKPQQTIAIQETQAIWRQGFILKTSKAKAIVQYLLHRASVEITLVGDLSDFAKLLKKLYESLKELVITENVPASQHIYPYVANETQQLFSVHSAEALIKVLASVSSYEQLFEQVKAMSGQEIHYHNKVIQNTGGEHSHFATDSHHFNQQTTIQTVELTANERQQLTEVVKSLLQTIGQLSPAQITAVAKVNEALASNQPEHKSLIATVWNGLKSMLDVTKTGTEISSFVLEHKEAIMAAITAATSAMS
jgi:pyrroloquinoline quinone (PQQ) biosynthesis protein C